MNRIGCLDERALVANREMRGSQIASMSKKVAAHYTPFTLEQTHGIVTLPTSTVRASSANLGWTSLLMSVQRETPFDVQADPKEDHLIVVHLNGPVRVRGRIDTRTIDKLVPPGNIFLWPAGSGFRVGVEQAVDTLHLYIRSAVVDEVAISMGYYTENDRRLAPRLGESDALLEQLVLEVRRASSRAVSDALYVEQLALAIAARLIRHNQCGTPEREPTQLRGLSSTQMQRIEDYIEANLSEVIPIRRLSAHSRLSVSHFVRLFRRATGVSPHQYVLRRRVERARRMLTETDEPIAQVALACGFSHQEHLTNIFKRQVGLTPTGVRRGGRHVSWRIQSAGVRRNMKLLG
jgi:AraC family transcriptional regulator